MADENKNPLEYFNPIDIPEEMRELIIPTEEFHRAGEFMMQMVRSRMQGEHHVPPIFLVAVRSQEEPEEELKEKICEEMGISKWCLEEVLENNGGYLRMFRTIGDFDEDEFNNHRKRLLFERGRDFDGMPVAVFCITEAWIARPDPDAPEEFDPDISPSEQPNREEVCIVAGLTLDRRSLVRVIPIDRDPDGVMTAGYEDKTYTKGKFRNYLLEFFWRGFCYKVNQKKKQANGDENEQNLPMSLRNDIIGSDWRDMIGLDPDEDEEEDDGFGLLPRNPE